MLADSLTELFAARALVYETARGIDRLRAGADVKVSHAQCSMAKLYSSEMAGRVADRAVQVFGGRGYMRENVAERFFRELRVERIWEGTSEIQRMIIARQMTKRGPALLAWPRARPMVVQMGMSHPWRWTGMNAASTPWFIRRGCPTLSLIGMNAASSPYARRG